MTQPELGPMRSRDGVESLPAKTAGMIGRALWTPPTALTQATDIDWVFLFDNPRALYTHKLQTTLLLNNSESSVRNYW